MQITLKDESLELVRENADGVRDVVNVDALELRMLLEEAERKHKLEQRDGFQFATREFLRDIADGLKELGLVHATVSMAYQVWSGFSRLIEEQKKSTSTESESDLSSGSTHSN